MVDDTRSIRKTRRAFLAITGTVAPFGLAGCLDDGTETDYGWQEVDSPTEKTLYDVVMSAEGPYAVGEDGQVIARNSDQWKIVIEDGPSGASNQLSGAAITDDSRHIWFAGSSGVVGQYDVEREEATDYSAPREKTSSWEDIAVTGQSGKERVYLMNGSGELLTGTKQNNGIKWDDIVKPGNGLNPTAIEFTTENGSICGTNGEVYQIANDTDWTRIGIPDTDVTCNDLQTIEVNTTNVVTDEGSIFIYNGSNWIRLDVSEDSLHAISRDGNRGFTVGTNGVIYELQNGDWEKKNTSTSRTLYGTELGTTDYTDVAVGGNGTILERFR